MKPLSPHASLRGSVLLLVLWMLILLGIVGLSYSSSVRTQVHALRASRGRVEALWAARAGVERARVALQKTNLNPLAQDDKLLGDAEAFVNQRVGMAAYSLIVPRTDPAATPVYGLVDEGSRVNLDSADEEMLRRLPGITDEMVDSLLDWRDDDSLARPLGAEDDYYRHLDTPYPARNGALVTLRELTRVRGWEPVFRQVWPDPYERFASQSKLNRSTMDIEDARRLLTMLTVWSADDGKAPDGQTRLDLGGADAGQMRERIASLTQDEAEAIEKWRRKNTFKQPTDLLDVTRPKPEDQNQFGGGGRSDRSGGGNEQRGSGPVGKESNESGDGGGRGGSRRSSSGERMFTLQRVGEIIDYFSVKQANAGGGNGQGETEAQAGRINVDTAPRDVLLCVSGIGEALADAIINQRARRTFAGAGGIVALEGVDEATFRKVYPCLTARSSRFHVWSRGVEPDSGATVTVEAVLAAADEGEVSIVYWRED